jgi:pimeloyl-ACP methyl ester carboxylesterase
LGQLMVSQRPKAMYPVYFFDLKIEGQDLRMAYRDVPPGATPNGEAVVLLHGKNFSGYYWESVIQRLTLEGYRVVAPEQIGFGASSRPNIHYSFHQMAENTKALLDHLHISRISLVGHSMGGMLAARFTLMYPETVRKLVLEDPLGLEDYRLLVPHVPIEELYKTELAATYESFRNYQKGYYVNWRPEYEAYVQDQSEPLASGEYPRAALASALTYEMIYEEPVCYEFSRIQAPTLLIVGEADRTVVGKARLSPEMKQVAGNYPELGRKTQELIRNSELVVIPRVGHIPHIEATAGFFQALLPFLGR